MSVLSIQVGQCGNQLGESFYNYLAEEVSFSTQAHQATVLDNFFLPTQNNQKYQAKSLLIDMEPKVVNECLQRNKTNNSFWEYDKKLSFCHQEGSGNNWAYGYNFHGPKCGEEIIEKLNSLIEKNDYIDGILLFQSLAGGTGSGLGSYIVEMVKDTYPNINIINVAILPHLTGEVILQSYNCILSISSLYQNSDGIILFKNDDLNLICQKQLNLKNPTLNDMNKVISHQLSSIFYPVFDATQKNKIIYSPLQNKFSYINDIISKLAYNPKYKLLNIYNAPSMPDNSKQFTIDTWGCKKEFYK